MWKKLRALGLTSLELCLDLVLLLVFSAQAFVAGCLLIYGYIPAPTQLSNDTLKTLSVDEFYIQADSFRLKLNGALELTNLQVFHGEMEDAILEANGAELRYTLFTDGAYKFTPTELLLSDGTLQMPAIYAPDGKRTAILENITFHLTPTDGLIRIDSIAARHDDITLRGSIDWPLQPTETEANKPLELADIYQQIATILTEKERFSPFVKPTLEFALSAQADNSIEVYTHLSCEALKYIYATGTNFNFHTSFTLKDGTLTPRTPLLLKATDINIPKFNLSATEISAYVAKDQWAGLLDGGWPDFAISAHTLNTHGLELRSPIAKLSPAKYPDISFHGSTSGLEGGAAFSGTLNSTTKSGYLHANGSVSLLDLFPDSALTLLPHITFGSIPYLDITIQLAEGMKLESTQFRIDTNQLTANGLTFDHLLASGTYSDGRFNLDRALIDREHQWIDATFSLDHNTSDFKISLQGSALPDQYSPLLPSWWPTIFQDIDFDTETLGYGDFVIYGSTLPDSEVFFLGHATATDVAYKKAHIDEGELIVRGRGKYIELHNIDAKTGGGWAKGDVSFTSGDNGLVSVRYAFDSLMPLDAASKIFGDTVATIISDFEVTQLPRITLDGANFTKSYPQYKHSDFFNLEASIDAPVKFKKTPLDHLQFALYSRDQDIYLRDVAFGYADGHGSAEIDIRNSQSGSHQLRFDLNLRGANQAKAVQNLPSLDGVEVHLTQAEAEADQAIKKKGKLDLNIHAQGPVDDLYQYVGYGDFTVLNNEIGSIQLLGPLSNLLENTRLNFTSFNLNQMSSSFEIQQKTLHFPDLIIEGPRTKIWAEGSMHVPDQALDMDIRVNLFANMGDPDSTINTFRKLITSPLPNLLVFDLEGTIQEQKLRLRYDPRKFIPVIKDL